MIFQYNIKEFRAYDPDKKVMYYDIQDVYDNHSDDSKPKIKHFGEAIKEDNIFLIVTQYVFNDSKGNKIFEGDIVFNRESRFNKLGVIVYSQIHKAYMVEHKGKGMASGLFSIHGREYNLEKRGSIFEDDNLVKEIYEKQNIKS